MAEILSWYYPQDVQLHSISNGASVQARLANWQLIEKVSESEMGQRARDFKFYHKTGYF